MKTCPFCKEANDDGHRFCEKCGEQLDSLVLSTGEPSPQGLSTVLLAPGSKPSSSLPRRSVPLTTLFSSQRELIVGRAPDCDICLQHPSVSRYHALFVRTPEGVQVSDLKSVNGVLVDGERIDDPILVREKQVIGIGPFLFSLLDDSLQSLDSSRGLRLEALRLEQVVVGFDGAAKKLLDNITLVVNPGEFVSLLGPSGSGKSTLMDCLNGRRRATNGKVLANGEDFYQHFDSFRQLLGYVPQKDIVHAGLTVHRALYYTARLRLPTDTDRTELNARVEEVLREMELLPHRDTLVAHLSGGQIKRVSLGAELLARPCMLYIDEATSGLDAGTEARMMRLFRRLSDEGRSIVCITHNVENVDQCHLALILARGKLLFYGPPAEAPVYFNVKRLSEIYDRIQEREPEEWEKEFLASKYYGDYVASRIVAAQGAGALGEKKSGAEAVSRLVDTGTVPPPSKRPLLGRRMHEMFAAAGRVGALLPFVSEHWHQLKVLTRRYAHLVWNDPRSLRLLWLQAPIVALFLLVGFINKPYEGKTPSTRRLTEEERDGIESAKEVLRKNRDLSSLTDKQRESLKNIPVPGEGGKGIRSLHDALASPDGAGHEEVLEFLLRNEEPVIPGPLIVNPAYTYLLLSIVVIAVLWFGCNNAAKEIVKEEAIYSRERAVNLKIAPYLGSKFLVLSMISTIQTFLFMLVLYGILEGLHLLLKQDVPPMIYQLDYPTQYGFLLLLSMSGVALGLLLSSCVASPDRASALLPYVLIPQLILGGGIIAVRTGVLYWLAVTLSPVYWAFRAVRVGECELPKDMYYRMDYDDSLWIPCVALIVQILVLLLLTAWFLKKKDAQ
jgi:ABC-type multidrug transport system ATPase subunit